jgi:hypothetical protein
MEGTLVPHDERGDNSDVLLDWLKGCFLPADLPCPSLSLVAGNRLDPIGSAKQPSVQVVTPPVMLLTFARQLMQSGVSIGLLSTLLLTLEQLLHPAGGDTFLAMFATQLQLKMELLHKLKYKVYPLGLLFAGAVGARELLQRQVGQGGFVCEMIAVHFAVSWLDKCSRGISVMMDSLVSIELYSCGQGLS